jgi:hypothetical protein
MKLSRIYCGRSVPNADYRHREIRDAGVNKFLAEEVAERFPAGFSVFHGDGAWRGASDMIRERMFCVEILHHDAETNKIREIAEAWKRWASQEAVLIVTLPVSDASFV